MSEIVNIAAYKFVPLDRLAERRDELRTRSRDLGLKGTILLSPEGINLFLAGPAEQTTAFLQHLRSDPRLTDLEAKESRVTFSRSIG